MADLMTLVGPSHGTSLSTVQQTDW